MGEQSEYTYERNGTGWAVYRWAKSEHSGYDGVKVSSHILREDARREVYRLNGWVNKRLEFSYNWNNKLNNKAFTTIRLWNEKKYQEGRKYDVWLNSCNYGFARLVSVKRMKLADINEHIALLDTGYSADECREVIKKMYKNKPIDWETQQLAYLLFVFEKEERKKTR